MMISNDDNTDDIEIVPMSSSTARHAGGEDVDLMSSSTKDVEEATKEIPSPVANSPSNTSTTQKTTSSSATDTCVKKIYSGKKKKISDIR